MASFGGAVKLTGESEYRAALRNISQNLKEVSSELKLVSSQYDKNDTSIEALTAKQTALTHRLEEQKSKLSTLREQYAKMGSEYQQNKEKHEQLIASYSREKSELERIGRELGTSSSEYKAQAAVVAKLKEQVDKSTTANDQNERSMSRMRTQINSAQADINKTSNEIKDLESQMGKSATSSGKLGESVEDAGEKARRAEGGFTVLKGAIANLAGNILTSAINGIQNLAGEAINSADALKKFESTMSFAGYDDSTISKAKDDMKLYADQTVYDLDTVANTTAQLAANGIQDYTGLTQAAGNLNAVAGGNAETFKSVAMVMTQTAGAGKLTTENWNQLADAIPGASGKLQEALQKNGAYTGNFRDAMEKGEITADEFNQAIMDLGFTDAAQQAATSTSTFEGAMGNMQAAVVDGLMQIYDAIGSENVTGFINGITDAVSAVIPPIKDGISWLKDNLPTIAPLLAAIAGAIGGLLVAEKITALVTAFSAWKTATEGVAIAQQLLNVVMSANPLGIVLTLIGALVAGFVALWTTNEGFREAVMNAWQGIQDFVGNAIQAIVDFFMNLDTTISQLPQMFAEWLSSVIATVTEWVSSMAAQAASAGSQFVSNVVNFITNLPANVASFLSSVISNVVGWVSNMASNASRAGSQFLSNAINFVSQLPGRIASFLGNVISNLGSWAGQMASRGAEGARNMFNAVVNGLTSLPGRVLSIGSDIVRGIWDGISGAGGWLMGQISNFASGVVDGIKGFFGIHSPSRVMRDQVGKYIAQGIGEGFSDEMGSVVGQMQDAMPDPSAFVSDQQMAYGGYSAAGTVANSSVVDAVIEALGRVHIVLDDEVAGKFVERTVTNAIYA
ncbi:tape measure protein [uncultured Senegalimassilia sp.]|uniref:tape measure protein n=1 Tax=uncultured Senegalimassilia sp. TaxID=1714350 RepID=UPI00261BD38B|nr:tape measure protein [uncultured Senegalimassilia sp.]